LSSKVSEWSTSLAGRSDGPKLRVPDFTSQEFWATLDVIGPRQVCVRRIAVSEVRQVEREDGAIWSA